MTHRRPDAPKGLTPEALARLRRRHIGFIFQSYNLFPTLTAEENVRLALDVRGERGSDAIVRAQRALQQVGPAPQAQVVSRQP